MFISAALFIPTVPVHELAPVPAAAASNMRDSTDAHSRIPFGPQRASTAGLGSSLSSQHHRVQFSAAADTSYNTGSGSGNGFGLSSANSHLASTLPLSVRSSTQNAPDFPFYVSDVVLGALNRAAAAAPAISSLQAGQEQQPDQQARHQ